MDNGQQQTQKPQRDRIGMFLFGIHILFLIMSVILVIRLISIQVLYKPNPKIEKHLIPEVRKQTTDPVRGSILTEDGRILASSTPMYQVYMDCTVRKAEFADKGDKGIEQEQQWLKNADLLAEGLAKIYGDKSAKEYSNLIRSGRVNGRKHVRIGGYIDHKTLLELKELPLFCESSYRGGMIVEKFDTRQYPYDNLARRTIGYVRNNSEISNNSIGIEGRYNYVLHGKEGVEWQKRTDGKRWIRNYDSTMVMVKNGLDIRTTIDVEIQDIADKSLRKKILESPNIEGGCAIVMDVETGGIKAMVNLKKDKEGIPREIYNYAIGRAGDPGSVFKLVTLMTLLEDRKINSLETKVPTFGGKWTYNGKTFDDPYIKDKGKEINIIDGFKVSSNNVFRYLTCKYYEDNPKRFLDKIYEYKLNEAFDFDLAGLAKPTVPAPGTPAWSGTMLPSIAIGYSITETPLHIVTFYNGVANKGKLMKPYLVKSFEKNGKVVEKFSPVILNGSICSRSTADTLTRALRKVTAEGTGRALKPAKCEVAGKTGTAQMPFTDPKTKKVVYKDQDGNRQHQASFVGFFPAENPKYTAIVVLYSRLGKGNAYGAAYAVPVFKDIVDNVYSLNEEWGKEIPCSGDVPKMKISPIDASDYGLEEIPSVLGLGLKDAIYTIENCGYKCKFEGCGHVAVQSPKGGTKAQRGSTVTINLK